MKKAKYHILYVPTLKNSQRSCNAKGVSRKSSLFRQICVALFKHRVWGKSVDFANRIPLSFKKHMTIVSCGKFFVVYFC